MNIFDRFISFMSRFTKPFYSSSTDSLESAKKAIEKQKLNQKRLKDSLTELIFQRKKMELQKQRLESNRLNLKQDLELAAHQDKDELAIRLMEELDLVVNELAEVGKNYGLIVSEIQTAKQAELSLAKQIETSRSQLAILISRSQSVKMKEELQDQFTKLHRDIVSGVNVGITDLEENILRLESRLENIQDPDWKQEVIQMRKQRTDHFRKARLEQLKMQMNSKKLPGRILVPEII